MKLKHASAFRALQNPGLFKYEHYRQAAIAVCAGILIRLVIAVPVCPGISYICKPFPLMTFQIVAVKVALWMISFFVNFEAATWDDKLVGGLDFVANSVLQLPFFLMSLMRYITPTLDDM